MSDSRFDVISTPGSAPIKHWTRGVMFEAEARKQVENIARMPFIHKHVAVMPDVHGGIGATIGSVIPTKRAIIPAAVGVDLGCGMIAQKTSLRAEDLPDDLKEIRGAIERAVPCGFHTGKDRDRGAWGRPPQKVLDVWGNDLALEFEKVAANHPKIKSANSLIHLGTLGSGNHFVEVCLDAENTVWFMLHSGSRGVGNQIGRYFIELAKEDMRKWFINLPDEDLAYFPEGTDHFDDYVEAITWAQKFAMKNREIMMSNVVEAVAACHGIPPFTLAEAAVNCHHNYAARESHFGENVWVTRKGAIRARLGDLGIIPGSMGARSYIVRGLGNQESFCSASHGAGRVMSRTAAKKRFTVEDQKQQTHGVECRKDAEVIDEIPAAYKDIDAVLEAERDLVEVVATLKQVVCVKG